MYKIYQENFINVFLLAVNQEANPIEPSKIHC